MNPVAFKLGPVTIYWYGIIIAAGILSGLYVAKKLAKIRGFNYSGSPCCYWCQTLLCFI